MQPALVAEKDARVELHAPALIIPEITGFQAERPLEMCARSLQVAHDDADLLPMAELFVPILKGWTSDEALREAVREAGYTPA